jgi:uncharacterized Zn-binding protein involved in type VI secretion
MALPVIRRGVDATTGHGCFPPVIPVGASPNVFADGIAIVRKGDKFAPHACPKIPPHSGSAVGGGKVYVNGKKAQRRGDGVTCGDTSSHGSSKVRFG